MSICRNNYILREQYVLVYFDVTYLSFFVTHQTASYQRKTEHDDGRIDYRRPTKLKLIPRLLPSTVCTRAPRAGTIWLLWRHGQDSGALSRSSASKFQRVPTRRIKRRVQRKISGVLLKWCNCRELWLMPIWYADPWRMCVVVLSPFAVIVTSFAAASKALKRRRLIAFKYTRALLERKLIYRCRSPFVRCDLGHSQ